MDKDSPGLLDSIAWMRIGAYLLSKVDEDHLSIGAAPWEIEAVDVSCVENLYG